MASINSVLTYNANLSPAQAQLKALTGQVGALTAAFNTLDKSAVKAQGALASTFLANVGQIGGFTSQIVQGGTAVDNFGKSLSKQRLTMRQYFREAISGYTKQNSMMKQLAAQQVRMQQSMMVPMGAAPGGGGRAAILTPTSLNAMSSAAALASQKFSIFNELVRGGSERLLNFGKNTQWTGRQLMIGFTLPLVMFTALVSKQFRDIDRELTRFEKVYGGDLLNTVESSTEKMREQVKSLAVEISSAYGIAASETAALAADIAQTGREGEELISSVKQTTRLAVLGEVERQEAMRATLSIQSAFKLSTNELSEAIDFLNAVENQTSTNLQDLAGAIPRVGPVIQALGGDIRDMSLLLVAMREGGVSAAEAANALKSGLGRLINPTKQARDVAAGFGVSLQEIIDNSRGELLPMIFGLQDALQGLDDFSRAQVIEKIFGKYQFARMSALFANLRRQGSQTLSVMELASASSSELAGIANQELRALQESTAMRFQRTIENLRNSLLPLGEILTEGLIPILSNIGKGISGFLNFFQALPEPVQNFTKYAVALTALAGPVVMLVGLFGNLFANTIKFSMGIVRIGAKAAGLRFEKFELLTADVIAAQMGVDGLTQSFTTQEVALRKLTTAMSTYSANLANLMRTNPQLFASGAPAPRMTPVIRRQSGSDRPEVVPGGFGGGDKIPALLEPGEFVVRKEAAKKYAPVLMQMNRGVLPGFVNGGSVGLRGGPSTVYSPYTVFAPGNVPGGFGMSRSFFESSELFEKSMRASAMTALAIEKKMSLTDKNLSLLSEQMAPITKDVTQALRSTAKEMQETGRDATHISQIMEQARPKIQAILSKITDPSAATAMQKLLYPTSSQILSMGNVRVPGVTVNPATMQATRMSMYSQRTGAAASFQSRLPSAAAFMGVPTSGGYTRAHLDLLRLSGSNMPFTGGALGADPRVRLAAEKALKEYTIKLSQDVSDGAVVGITKGASQQLQSKSPSRVAISEFNDEGRNLAKGALIGMQQGAGRIIGSGTRNLNLLGLQSLQQTTGTGPAVPVGFARISALQQQTGPGPTSIYPRQTGPSQSLAAAQQSSGMRGMGVMNAMFALSMLTSTFSMLGGQSNDLARNLGILTSAVMAASMAMMMFSGKNVMGNFLGMRSIGGRLGGSSAARLAANPALAQRASSIASAGGLAGGRMAGAGVSSTLAAGGGRVGATLLGASRILSVLGGPIGIAAGLAVTGVITGFMILKNRAEEARERMVAAFKDPTKVAEYFGQTIKDVNKVIEQNQLANVTNEITEQVDDSLRSAVREDYSRLIERLGEVTSVTGARELSIAFASMITSGISAENAKAAIKAIAVEAGTAGGEALSEATLKGFLNFETVGDAVNAIASQFDPSKNKQLSDAISNYESRIQELEQRRAGVISGARAAAGERPQITGSIRPGDVIPGGFRVVSPEGAGGPMVLTNEEYRLIADANKEIQEIKSNLEEIFNISPEKLIPSIKQLIVAYSDAPQEVSNALSIIEREIISSTENQGQYLNEIKSLLNETYSEDMQKYGNSIDTIHEATAALKLITSGVSLDRAVDSAGEFNLSLANALVKAKNLADVTGQLRMVAEEEYFGMIDQFFERERIALQSQLEIIKEDLETEKEDLEKSLFGEGEFVGELQIRGPIEYAEEKLDDLRRSTQYFVKSRENLIDSYQDEIDVVEERYEKEIEVLEDQKNSINESTDAYINSLQKRQRADTFYANQRKTAFSALQKLAAGDVFGFLQDRQQMSQDAQQFAFDEQIKNIEDRRDAEIEVVDNQIEARRKEHEQYKKNMEEKIQLERDLIEQQQDALESQERSHQILLDQYEDQALAAQARADAETESVRDKISRIETAENDYRTNATSAEEKYSKDYSELKSRPYVEARKEFMKLRVEEIFYRGDVTLAEAMRQAGFSTAVSGIGDAAQRAMQAELEAFAADLNLRYGTRGRFRYGPSDTFQGPVVPDTGISQPFAANEVNIQDPQNVYINGVDVESEQDWTTAPGSAGSVTPEPRESGGFISGPGTATSDSIPARLSNGEYVIKASSVRKYGKDMMDSINAARFAEGGPVGDAPRPSIGRATPSFVSGITLPKFIKPAENPPASNTGSPTTSFAPPPQGAYGGPVTESGLGFAAARYAVSQQGKPYSMNAQPPNSWDCSKLTAWSWNNGSGAPAGKYSLIPYSHSQANQITKKVTSRGPNMPIEDRFSVGDILYFKGIGSQSGGHTSMYVGNGKVFEASSPSIGLRYSDLNNSFNRRYFAWGGTPIPNFATGGFVTGPGGSVADKIPAMLSNGEYVVRASAVDKYGKGMLDQINSGQFGPSPKMFAGGGMVGGMGYAQGGMVSPAFDIPSNNISMGGSSVVAARNTENFNNNSNVKIVINGANGNAQAIANKVVRMINQANNRRNHSRSTA